MEIFIDLEGTIIKSWDNPVPLYPQIEAIKGFMKLNAVDKVSIYSFAIQSSEDVSEFNHIMRPELERELNVLIFKEVLDVFGIAAIAKDVRTTERLFAMGKETVFERFVEGLVKANALSSNHVVLFDDMTKDKTIAFGDIIIDFKNIDHFTYRGEP